MAEHQGKVYLVGAGPGDPQLITLKGKRCLEEADVVLYDRLASESLLTLTQNGAELIYVGKSADRHALSQEEINQVLIDKALEGKIVVRLKGGDPYIFGRGGEEALQLAEAKIPFEVIPGVTSSSAVPAYAGIPVTHRGLASSVAFITGHEDPTKETSTINWEKLSMGVDTLVFLMGVGNLPLIVDQLQAYGRPPETPVAVIQWGTTPSQRTVIGTLANIVERVQSAKLGPPAITVVGSVVKFHDQLNWFEKKPLLGQTIVVTRSREQASEFAELLQEYGARVIEFPTIETVPVDNWDEVDRAIEKLESYLWAIFTSASAVKGFLARLKQRGRDLRALKGIKLCAIGAKTAAELEKFGISVDLIPSEYRAEGVIEAMGKEKIDGANILFPRAEVARELLPDTLRHMGATVDIVAVYRTIKPTQKAENLLAMLREGEIDLITFTSSSTVINFVEIFKGQDLQHLLRGVKIGTIGSITANTAEQFGLKADIIPQESTIEAFLKSIVASLA
ncbi:MAG: uroporphyrinogen-III C-methyltransferase [Candidatus Tectomicrobia bacterium]|nr:uroporphyrinogen-III C-methyltransferase [Candidatus Tectomicrobia bacterium]